jgi:3-methyladenine DNA glycosylase AlkD
VAKNGGTWFILKMSKEMAYSDRRLRKLRSLFRQKASKEHATFHKNYHKSSKDFYGLYNRDLTEAFRAVFPRKVEMDCKEVIPLALQLWASNWFEEQAAGLSLLARMVKQLTPKDLPMLKKIADECEGWAMLDYLATLHLGMLALDYGEAIYSKVRKWTKSKHMWTRRAAILIHVLPARKKALNERYAWSTFEELLHEKEFFIRKAIGWTLRECSRYYPEKVFEFIRDHVDQMSGLTLREGSRKLPEPLQKKLGI